MAFGKLTLTPNQYLYYQDASNSPELQKTFIFGKILNSFVTITYIEEFRTKKYDFYEVYINPPEGCVVYDVKAKYNDKTTEFVVNKLEEPTINGYYDSDSNSDAINLTLGLIPENISVKLEITCTFTAIFDSNKSYSFQFPSDPALLNADFSADITLVNYNSNSNIIQISEGKYTIENGHIIIPTIKLSKQFQILLEYNENIQSSAFLTQIGQFNYLGLSLHPNESFEFSSNLKQEIYLLIDCSGSMSGSKIIAAQTALKNFLNELPKNCYFNILRFGSTFEQMFETSAENNEQNIKQSLSYASTMKADLGSTDIYSPLMSIIGEKPRKGYVRQVFALTDGEVESPANVLAACTKVRNIMRVFPFGIGSDVNHAFLKELAKSTMGKAHFIKNENKNEISDKVLSTLKSSQVKAIVNNEIHIEGIDSFEIAPHPIPSMYSDNFVHVIARYKNSAESNDVSILVSGECGEKLYEETLNIKVENDSINLEKLFAYHNIRDMEDQLIDSEEPEKAMLIKENIVRLSTQCAVVSSFTGMFTVINGIKQKPEDLQKEMEKYNEEVLNKQQQTFQPQQQFPQPQQQMFQPQQQMFQLQQQMFQPQQQMFQPQQQFIQPQQPMFQPQKQMFQPQQQFPQPQQPMFQPQQQMFQSQQPMSFQPMQQCQQPITQKQCRNQLAFEQVSRPVKQAKQMWGGHQVHQPTATKIVKQQVSQVLKQKQSKIQSAGDQIITDLLKKQNSNGSWNDISLVEFLVNIKKKNPTIKDMFAEYPSVGNKMKALSDECILTLLVIGWLYSQRKNLICLFSEETQNGLKFIRSDANIEINDNGDQFTNGISWKLH